MYRIVTYHIFLLDSAKKILPKKVKKVNLFKTYLLTKIPIEKMEELQQFLKNDLLKGFEGLSTFEPFIKQASYLIYEKMHKSIEDSLVDENIECPIDDVSASVFPPEFYDHEKMVDNLYPISKKKREVTVKPEYIIKEKKTEKIKNPKTGRMIYKDGELFKGLVEQGWMDADGKVLKEHVVKRIKNPKTGKPLTIGCMRFDEMVKEGWVDAKGGILQVVHPTTKKPLSVKDSAFETFVEQNHFHADGTVKSK